MTRRERAGYAAFHAKNLGNCEKFAERNCFFKKQPLPYMEKTKKDEMPQGILIGCRADSLEPEQNSDEHSLEELAALLETAGGEVFACLEQHRPSPDPKTYIGTGKLQEIKEILDANEDLSLVVFDNDLSPSQLRNIQEILGVRVIDRAALILDIFAQRAGSAEGKLQVELAQYKYLLPRLSGLGQSLSRLGGGIGTRGPGESKLETDRRHIRARISKLEQDIKDVCNNRATARRKREKSGLPMVALVGYTNAGKSTLFNTLTGSDIAANNRLFDTLDPTTRPFEVDDKQKALLSDTVGFIRRLPHHLIAAFVATLEELKYADLVLLVLDIADEQCEKQAEVVCKLVDELCERDTPRLFVLNKADCALPHAPFTKEDNAVLVSAKTGEGIDALKEAIIQALGRDKKTLEVTIPYNKAALVRLLHTEGLVQKEEYTGAGIVVKATVNAQLFGRLAKELEG